MAKDGFDMRKQMNTIRTIKQSLIATLLFFFQRAKIIVEHVLEVKGLAELADVRQNSTDC